MNTITTYSFEDVITTFNHPSVGSKSTVGAGVGTINISSSGDRTVHNVASDGSVMISKVNVKNGTFSVTFQQTSQIHKYLLQWYNYIDTAATSEWATMTVTVTSKGMGDNTILTGVSPQKLPDKPYQAEGQMVTWNLMFAERTEQ